MQKIEKIRNVDGVAAPRAPYSTYTRVGNLIFLSGQVAVDPQTETIPQSFAAQLKLIFENINIILKSVGSTLENILKTTVFLKDLSDYAEYNEIYREYFKSGFPARTTVVADLAHDDFLVEIEAIAWVPEKPS